MAVVNEYTLQGNDQVTPAFKKAENSTKQLGREMKGLGSVINQTGNLAYAFGNTQLAGAINGLESAVAGTRAMTNELGKSKLAFVAVAAAATMGGYAIGEYIRKWIPFFNEVDKLEAGNIVREQILEIQIATLRLSDANKAEANAFNHDMDMKLLKMKQLGVSTKEQAELQFQIERLRSARAEDASKKSNIAKDNMAGQIDAIDIGNRMRGGPDEQRLAMVDEETLRFEKQQRDMREQMRLTQTAKADIAAFEEASLTDHYARLAIIDGTYYANLKRLEEIDKARKLAIQDQVLHGTSDMFGNLATAAKAFGKKGLAAWKAFSTAQAIIDTYKAANAAYAAMAGIPFVGPALGIAAAAAAIAAGLANVAAIQSTNASGQAHDGLDYVPRTGSYILEQGEAVIKKDQNERIDEMLGGGGGGWKWGDVYLDAQKVGRVLWGMSKNGQLQISMKAVT